MTAGKIPGAVAPTADALASLTPLGLDAVTLDADGYLGAWQRRSGEATLVHCIDNVESSGNLGNLRRAAGQSDEAFRGMWFADSDVYKTLEAAAWHQAQAPDAGPAREFIDSVTKLLADAQDADGYLNSWFQVVHPDSRWTDLRWGHELYCAGHLFQAAVAAARTGSSSELVAVATTFADLLVDRYGEGHAEGICGHPEVETALVELFRVTGRRAYLDLAGRMVELRGHQALSRSTDSPGLGAKFGQQYFQDHEPVRTATAATGHAVRQLYLEAGVVDVAVETGDRELLAASERIWDDLFATKTYVTGAHGSRHRDEAIGDAFELPPDRAYAESCAAIASFQWNWRLLLATGRHRYADELERVLYNAVAGSTAVDGQHFFYSNPLQLRTGHDGSDEDAPSSRLSWYGCACCPPNLARLLASLPGYLATTDPAGVQVHLYSDATIRAGAAELRVRTDYPWDGRVDITVTDPRPGPWTLALRVPGWCPEPRVSVAGQVVDVTATDGYLRVQREWADGEQVVLDLPMPPRVLTADDRVDAVRGCVALARGPLVYCIEQADLPDGVAVEDVRLDAEEPPVTVSRSDLLDVPVVLAARAEVAPRTGRPLYAGRSSAPVPGRPLELVAIPYYRWANREPGAMRVWIPLAPVTGSPPS